MSFSGVCLCIFVFAGVEVRLTFQGHHIMVVDSQQVSSIVWLKVLGMAPRLKQSLFVFFNLPIKEVKTYETLMIIIHRVVKMCKNNK